MIVAITMVRDEIDILPWTLAHMLDQVDYVIVADNGSVDGTREHLADMAAASPSRLLVQDDPEPGYYQADKMTRLAHQAGDMGATWVVPFDADEAWDLPDLATLDADVITVRPWWHVPHNDDPVDPNPLVRIRWRLSQRQAMPKVAFRYHPHAQLHMGNHAVRRPIGSTIAAAGEMRHYPFRSLDQTRRKVTNGAQAYRAAPDLDAGYGAHWRQLDSFDDDALEAWWRDLQARATDRA